MMNATVVWSAWLVRYLRRWWTLAFRLPVGGALEFVSVAAATAVVGYDLLSGSRMRQSNLDRTLVAAGLAGSAAAGDTVVELYVGTTLVAVLYNLATGFPNRDSLMRIGAVVPAGVEVVARVTDAPATNAINLVLDFA